jgi:hypothetical protein
MVAASTKMYTNVYIHMLTHNHIKANRLAPTHKHLFEGAPLLATLNIHLQLVRCLPKRVWLYQEDERKSAVGHIA